jgi:hypothetical protein
VTCVCRSLATLPVTNDGVPERRERRARASTARPRFGGAFSFDMNADIERLIALQRLDSAAQDAPRRLADEPERQKAFDARLDAVLCENSAER